VNVDVALRMESLGIVRDAPLFAPQFFRLGDRISPQLDANIRRERRHRVHPRRMLTGQRQPPVGLSRTVVFDEEDRGSRGLPFRLRAQSALALGQGRGLSRVAGAGNFTPQQRNRR